MEISGSEEETAGLGAKTQHTCGGAVKRGHIKELLKWCTNSIELYCKRHPSFYLSVT